MTMASARYLTVLLRPFALLAVAVLLGCSTAWGQPAENGNDGIRYWAYAGPSLTTLGLGGNGGLAVEFGGNVLSARTTTTDPVFGRETWEVALLYGRMTDWRAFLVSGGVGVSVVGGMSYTHLFGNEAGTEFEPMIGFPLEGQIAWAPTGVAALGLHAVVNVNTAHPFGGLGMSIRVGDVW